MLYFTLCIAILLSTNICQIRTQYISRSRINVSHITNDSDNHIAFLKTYEIVDSAAISDSFNIHVNIRAFGIRFVLRLVEDITLLEETKIIVTENGRTFSLENKPKFYRGSVLVDNIVTLSEVYGTVIGGRFQGVVTLPNETYYIEPLKTYLTHRSGSIMYRSSDVSVPFIDPENSDVQTRRQRLSSTFRNSRDRTKSRTGESGPNTRHKRNIDFNRPRSCGLLMFADHRFHNAIGHGNLIETIAALTYRYREVDRVFRGHDFNSDNIGDNFGFTLEVVYVHSDMTSSDISYPFEKDTSNGIDMLKAFKSTVEENFGRHCINYGFTHAHWDENIVGLAYTASPYNPAAGLCGRYSNMGIVTSVIHRRTMTTVANVLVFAHELGHSSGSDHDEKYEKDNPESCKRPTTDGLYIMTARTTSPNEPNSFKFSPCSKQAIIAVLKNRIELESCFRDSAGGPYCGNQIVDRGEECDCGTVAQCHKIDHCCTPAVTRLAGHGPGKTLPSKTKECTVNREKSYVCSPKSSACCTDQCQAFTGVKICAEETECQKAVNCDQKSSICPRPDNKPDGTECSDGRFCKNGTCSVTICDQWGMTDCACNNDESCIRCCAPTDSASCAEVTVLSQRLGLSIANDASKYVVYGTLCSHQHGICDDNHECKVYSHDNDEIFSGLFITNVALEWFRNHWYYTFIAILALLVLTYLFRNHLHCRQEVDYTSTAKRMGRVLGLENETDRQLAILKLRIKRIERNCSMPKRRPYVDAMSRIHLLFPTAPEDTISGVLWSVSGEVVAVKQLLVMHFPMLRLFTSAQTKVARHSKRHSKRRSLFHHSV